MAGYPGNSNYGYGAPPPGQPYPAPPGQYYAPPPGQSYAPPPGQPYAPPPGQYYAPPPGLPYPGPSAPGQQYAPAYSAPPGQPYPMPSPPGQPYPMPSPPGQPYPMPSPPGQQYAPPPISQPPYGAPLPVSGHQVSLSPQEMSMAVDQLRGAMRGLGTDEHALIAILTRYSPAQMIQISQAYKGTFGVSLAEQIRKETSFKFGATCEALATPLPEYEALCLEKAMRGMGTNEKLLVEILAGRSNYELQVIRQAYQAIFHKELEQAVHSELSGDFRRFMIALLQGRRDESGQISDVNADIDTLYRAGEGKWGTDEGAFIGILCTRSYPVLVSIFDGYQRKHNHTFEKAIEKEFSGHLKHGILALVHSARNRADYIATELEDAMHGLGTNDEKLIRTLVRHREPRLMQAVKHAFSQRYGKSLYGRVEGETSGDYRRVVLAIVGAN